MNPPTHCPLCDEKLVCNFRDIEGDTLLQEEMECPERHYLYQLSWKGVEITLG